MNNFLEKHPCLKKIFDSIVIFLGLRDGFSRSYLSRIIRSEESAADEIARKNKIKKAIEDKSLKKKSLF